MLIDKINLIPTTAEPGILLIFLFLISALVFGIPAI